MNCGVIGIGAFGYHVATTLSEHGHTVVAIDKELHVINSLHEKVAHAFCVEHFNEETLREVGFGSVDVAIIGLSHNFDLTILLAVLLKKKLHVPKVICRTTDQQNKEILELIGVDQIILPEQESGTQLADTITAGCNSFVRVTENHSIIKIHAKNEWIGKKIGTIFGTKNDAEKILFFGKLEKKHINSINIDYEIQNNDIFCLFAKNEYLNVILEK